MEKTISNDIMRRVRFIYGLRSLWRVFVPKIALLASFVALAGFFVSLPNVLRNMPSLLETQKLFEFAAAAFLNTKFAVQIIALGTLAVIFYIICDVVKTFRASTNRGTVVA